MKFAIMECVVTPGGHEIDYDRILVEELTALGHEVEFYVPEGHVFKWNYGVPVHAIPGGGVSYKGARGLKKLCLAVKREFNRQRWYRAMFKFSLEKRFDAIIFPSATYRYLRALAISPLRYAQTPVLFLMHGLTPKECVKLNAEAGKFKNNANVRIGVQTFAAEKLTLTGANIRTFGPPNYIPRDIAADAPTLVNECLTLGFFGQYRREKNLDALLEVYKSCAFTRPVKLVVQGSTQTPDDAADFERIIAAYGELPGLEFWHKPLIGAEWQQGIASVDAIVMPYGNDRYLYHTSAILSNAIGFRKTVVSANNVNPEILNRYEIGITFQNGDLASLKSALERFVNTYDDKKEIYRQELDRAYADFAPDKLARNIAALAEA